MNACSPDSKRVFVGIDGQEYFWKPASRRLEVRCVVLCTERKSHLVFQCFDKNDGLLAVYEYLVDDPSYAKLDIKPLGVGDHYSELHMLPLLTLVLTLVGNDDRDHNHSYPHSLRHSAILRPDNTTSSWWDV